MGKKDKSSGNANGNGSVSHNVEVDSLRHEVKRLVRLRDTLIGEIGTKREEFQRLRRLYARDSDITKHDLQQAYLEVTRAQKALAETDAQLTIEKVKYERAAFPQKIKCGECGDVFKDHILFQRHLQIAKQNSTHCLFYRMFT